MNVVFVAVCCAGIVKEPDKPGKSYAVFAVTVKKKVPYAEEEEIWDVYRRYSDFHDLNMILIEKVFRAKSSLYLSHSSSQRERGRQRERVQEPETERRVQRQSMQGLVVKIGF